jgi:hypothetical protein
MPVAEAMATLEIAYLLEIIRDAETNLPGFCAVAHTRRITAGCVSFRPLSLSAVLVS